jgi:orotate phosphoribosyltransferase
MNKITARKVAEALIDINAVGFSIDKPITFKSGIIAPMYVDNRKFPSHPEKWRIILDAFIAEMKEQKVMFDLLAGIETAGIPHSAGLGVLLAKPSVFIRKAVKDHGTKKMVEGGEVKGKTALLIEDLVTTGGSSLHGVEELRAAGAKVRDCMVIVSYGFPESQQAFKTAKVRLLALTDVETILTVAEERKILTADDKITVTQWYKNPWQWGK